MTFVHHVVDILDEYYSGVEVVEIFDECAVAAGTEYELAVIVAEKFVVGSYG